MINKLIEQIRKKQAPIVVGLDAMLGYIPKHILDAAFAQFGEQIVDVFHRERPQRAPLVLHHADGATGVNY